jgi:hypothetical protein
MEYTLSPEAGNSARIAVLLQDYDPLWQGGIGTSIQHSLPVFAGYNGFLVADTNASIFKIEYGPEGYWFTGAVVASLSLAVATLAVLLSWMNLHYPVNLSKKFRYVSWDRKVVMLQSCCPINGLTANREF